MDPKKKIYLLGLIFGVLNIALIIFLVFPLINSLKKSSQDLISQRKELISFSEKKENFKNLEKIYQANQKKLEEIELLFIDPETPIDFIDFLENTAKDPQVSIKISLAPEKKQESDFGPTLSFNISRESSYPNFLKFLEKLENGPYLIEIQNLNIKKLEEEKISAALQIKVLTK